MNDVGATITAIVNQSLAAAGILPSGQAGGRAPGAGRPVGMQDLGASIRAMVHQSLASAGINPPGHLAPPPPSRQAAPLPPPPHAPPPAYAPGPVENGPQYDSSDSEYGARNQEPHGYHSDYDGTQSPYSDVSTAQLPFPRPVLTTLADRLKALWKEDPSQKFVLVCRGQDVEVCQ